MRGGGIDWWKVEADLANVEIWYFKLVPYIPFIIILDHDGDRMHLGCEGYELGLEIGSSEQRCDFWLQFEAIFDEIFISYCDKVHAILFYENPLLLFDYKSIQ